MGFVPLYTPGVLLGSSAVFSDQCMFALSIKKKNTPSHDGIAKRRNRHLLENARTLLFQMHVPKHF